MTQLIKKINLKEFVDKLFDGMLTVWHLDGL
jgi:hypothetical protein